MQLFIKKGFDLGVYVCQFLTSYLPLRATTVIISNEEMNDILKIVKSLEESGLLINSVIAKNQNEAQEQKRGFLSVFLGTLGASLLGNLLTGQSTTRAGKGTIRPGQEV